MKLWYKSSTGSYVRVEVDDDIYEGDLVKVQFAGLDEPLMMSVDRVLENCVQEVPKTGEKFSDRLQSMSTDGESQG